MSFVKAIDTKLKDLTFAERFEFELIMQEAERRMSFCPEATFMDFHDMYEKVRQERIEGNIPWYVK